MKCFLLLLASTLVTSDKLDRTYLPPPGAQYSGGTLDDLHPPLALPKETIPNGPATGFYTDKRITGNQDTKQLPNIPFDHPTSISNNFNQINSSPIDRNMPNVKLASGFNSNFPAKFPSSSYLPSKQLASGSSLFVPFNPKSGIFNPATIYGFKPESNPRDTGYYYVPAMQPYGTKIVYQDNNQVPVIQPNKINKGNLIRNRQRLIANKPINNDIVQNYQPNAFGYYGGNPMIMTSQNLSPQNYQNSELISKFGVNEQNFPVTENVRKPDNKNKSVLAFQTPLVKQNEQSEFIINDSQTLSDKTASSKNMSELPGYNAKNFSNNKFTNMDEQRNRILIRPRYKPEKPQAKSDSYAEIVNYENNISPEGYSYSYDTLNGIHAHESGTAIDGVKAKGSYSYTSDDGKVYTVTYTADEHGFRPIGDHLPTAPPLPDAIKKLVEEAERNEASGFIDDGSYDEKKYGYMNYQGAMDRYNTFKTQNRKMARPNIASKTPNNFSQNFNFAKNDSRLLNELTPKLKAISENFKMLNNIDKNLENQKNSLQNNYKSKHIFGTENKSNIDQINNDKVKPITYPDGREIENETRHISPSAQIPDKKYAPINSNIHSLNNPNPNTKVSLTDDGYYYVPPFIKFNAKSKKPETDENLYLTTENFAPKTTTDEGKLTDFDGPQKRINIDKPETAKLPINVTSSTSEPTRQPYISGPIEQDKIDDSTDQLANIVDNDINKQMTYASSKNTQSYDLNTTPMTTQTAEEDKTPDEYIHQYHQSTTSPTVFDTTLPAIVENRVNIPLENPGITVTQDFVTTTYKPILSNGVLEVSQNVKIYGIGSPETGNNAYSENVPAINNKGYAEINPMYNNDKYLPNTGNGELNVQDAFPGYFYQEPFQGTHEFRDDEIYGSDQVTAEVPTDYGVTNYSNVGDKITQDDKMLNSPFIIANNVVNPQLISVPEITTPLTIEDQVQNGRIIGEDFSGPKQPQKFDPANGYYYK